MESTISTIRIGGRTRRKVGALKPVDYHTDLDIPCMHFVPEQEYEIVSVYFPSEKKKYETFKQVFVHSANANTNAYVRLVEVSREVNGVCRLWWANNLQKARMWAEIAQTIEVPTVFMDVDVLVRDDLLQGFQRGITITRRPLTNSWFNSGAVWVMPTPEVKAFFLKWYEEVKFLIKNETILREASRYHVGLHQTSFIRLLERGEITPSVGVLDGNVWNATRNNWNHCTDETKVIHVTARLWDEIARKRPRRFVEAAQMYKSYACGIGAMK